GWFTERSGGERITSESVLTNTINHTLYAQWIRNSGSGSSYIATSSIVPSIAFYDAGSAKDLVITLKPEPSSNRLVSIANGNAVLKEGTNYTVSSDGKTITLKTGYLNGLKDGKYTLTFKMASGSSPQLTLTVTGSIALIAEPSEPKYKPMAPLDPVGTKTDALKTNNILILDEEEMDFPAVKIHGFNWIKLRDLATLLNGTKKQFSISYDETTRIVDIRSNLAYSPLGDELQNKLEATESALATSQRIRIDGAFVDIAAYNIKGYNYFRLRDLAILLDFMIDYDEETTDIILDLENPYEEKE
ncbi:MAG: hypothetical protein FWG43_05490, partial [Clostridiales bacterium]|nr:hypothetical protein [Clostridiales bacterium]